MRAITTFGASGVTPVSSDRRYRVAMRLSAAATAAARSSAMPTATNSSRTDGAWVS